MKKKKRDDKNISKLNRCTVVLNLNIIYYAIQREKREKNKAKNKEKNKESKKEDEKILFFLLLCCCAVHKKENGDVREKVGIVHITENNRLHIIPIIKFGVITKLPPSFLFNLGCGFFKLCGTNLCSLLTSAPILTRTTPIYIYILLN